MSPATWDALAMLLLIVGPPAFLLGVRLILAAWESWSDRRRYPDHA